MQKMKDIVDWLIRGKDGRVYLIQFPNLPLMGWIVCVVIAHAVTGGAVKTGFSHLGTAFLAVWSYLEITQGSSRIRQVLGAVVAAVLVYGFFTL